MRVVVTGANGFIGSAVVAGLERNQVPVRRIVRHATRMNETSVGAIGPDTDWAQALHGSDVVIHTAARCHVLKETEYDPLAAFRKVNVEGTRRLGLQASGLGVRRFVFLSTIAVHGDSTEGRAPFHIADTPSPATPYALSKWEGEEALHQVAEETGLEIVIIRAPMVYGPGAPGNFQRLVKLVRAGLPLPLGSVKNRRSFVGIDNLVDVLRSCVNHPAAAGRTFLVSDGEDLSTLELIQGIARAVGRPCRLFPTPIGLLRRMGELAGRRVQVNKLIDSLQVDIRPTRDALGWSPATCPGEGIRRAVEAVC